jgi:glycosyltransferase involved in cell wall biosynthesis
VKKVVVTHQLSIIIPTYNGENYIENCINSILKQESRNIEIIVIDDYSSDRTVDIVKDLFGVQVKLIRNHKRLGMASNYEKALKIAKGDWVSILGQDDLMLPNSVSRIQRLIDKNSEIDVIVSSRSYYYWDNYIRNKNQIKLMIYKNNLVTRKISSKNP